MKKIFVFLMMMVICGSGDFLVTTHLIPMVTDFDISPATAADMLAWFGLLSMGGILIAGPASDRIGNKMPIALTFALRLFLFLLILKYQNTIKEFLNLAPDKRLAVGVCLGYTDTTHPINHFQPQRVSLDQLTKWMGFAE